MKSSSIVTVYLLFSLGCLLASTPAVADLLVQVPPSIQLPADGKSLGTLKVSVLNNGKAAPGCSLSAVVSPPTAAKIATANQVTDSNGEATFSLQAGTSVTTAAIAITTTVPGVTGSKQSQVPLTLTVPLGSPLTTSLSSQLSSGTAPTTSPSAPPQVTSTLPIVSDIYPKTIDVTVPIWPWGNDGEPVDADQQRTFVVSGLNFPPDAGAIQLSIGGAIAKATYVEPDRTRFYAVIDSKGASQKLVLGKQNVQVIIDKTKLVTVNNPAGLSVTVTSRTVDYRLTVLVLALTIAAGSIILAALGKVARNALGINADTAKVLGTKAERKVRNDWIPLKTAALLLDTETNTYSLARAQFLWWVALIVYGWIFLFIGRWFIEGSPAFIPVSGFAYTFMISLTTLIAASATSIYRGTKGGGDVYPAPSDLVAQGGVVALERIQQVVWTMVIGIAFAIIIVMKYDQSASFPPIPNELLALMGVSAAGYIGGKAVRQPGPNVGRVEAEVGKTSVDPGAKSSGPCLIVYGDHLSNGNRKIVNGEFVVNDKVTDAGVTVFIVPIATPSLPIPIPQEKVATQDFDPDSPGLFARTLKIDMADTGVSVGLIGAASTGLPSLLDFWKAYSLTIVNADGQRAVFTGTFASAAVAPPATVLPTTVAQPPPAVVTPSTPGPT